MTIEAGQQLFHYRLIEQIGEGGMGVVWKAMDTTLDRAVAIKFLPEALAADPDRLARFEREAKLLASLNHPNIAAVYGLHESQDASNSVRFISMELVPGEDLAQRLVRGPLGVEEALAVSRQIADALEGAHENGVIHRDLKPANVKLDPEGRVRVLDFGLAKALDPTVATGSADPAMSPTMTSHTVAGMILGTAAYMSPEQARGQAVDRRADIWAFGCLLYELISGKRPFQGETVSDTMAAVLTREPDWTALPETVPDRVRELIRRCLNKNPRMRLRDIGDARIELDVATAEPAGSDNTATEDSATAHGGRRGTLAALALIAGLALGGATGYLVLRDTPLPVTSTIDGPLRSHIVLPDELPLATGSDAINSIELRSLAMAPDGSSIVYVTRGEGAGQLVQRRIGSFDPVPIRGTEGAFSPAFSPDGQWVAFLTPSELKKIPLDRGDPVVLCEAHVGFSTTWAEDGYVYFTHHQEQLARIGENGGEIESFVIVDDVLTLHALPGARGLLANRRSRSSVRMDDAEILHIDGQGRVTSILSGGYAPSYSPSGHLVFVRGGGLYAAAFDLDKLQTNGPPVPIVDGVATDSIWAGAQYGISRSGMLVYLPRDDWARTRPTWIDREGNLEPLDLPEQLYNNARLSRDQTKLALQIAGANDQIHVYDFRRKTLARLTLGGGNRFPKWKKDERIVFAGFRNGVQRMYSQPLDGSADAERVLTDEQSAAVGPPSHFPNSVSPDGKVLLFCTVNPETSYDLWTVSLEADEEPTPLLTDRAGEALGSFSPDGRWIVYMSDKTGRWEVYVRPFPDVDRREWRVSSGGGDDPMWSPRPGELFYRDGPRLYGVRYTADPDFEPGPPELVLETDFHNSYGLSFDVSLDGRRFLVNRPVVAGQPNAPLRLIQNWTDELP